MTGAAGAAAVASTAALDLGCDTFLGADIVYSSNQSSIRRYIVLVLPSTLPPLQLVCLHVYHRGSVILARVNTLSHAASGRDGGWGDV